MSSRGRAYILSAPAGTGKTTLMQRLADELPHVIQSISYTTRTPREGEHPGKDYHFVGLVEFKRMIEAGEFVSALLVLIVLTDSCVVMVPASPGVSASSSAWLME